MKPLSFKIPKTAPHSIHTQEDRGTSFYPKLHIHPEIQFTWIKSGHGTLLCNDYIGEYNPGDVYVIGSNVPHLFRSEPQFEGEISHSYTFFIDEFLLLEFYFSQGDRPSGEKFVKDSLHGLKLNPRISNVVHEKMDEVYCKNGIGKIVSFGELLTQFLADNTYTKCSEFAQIIEYSDKEGERLSRVMNWMMECYMHNLRLKEAAAHASLSISAFCRFFKQRTGKTFVDYLNEIRINQACRLLQSSERNIGEIADVCGYESVSLFNRRFREFKEMTPSDYRKASQV